VGVFRFEIGQRVPVVSHPASPAGIIVRRWTGPELGDVYGENIYEVSGFVTKQRESSLRSTPETVPGGEWSGPGLPVSPD
jgi:hypothetical protein